MKRSMFIVIVFVFLIGSCAMIYLLKRYERYEKPIIQDAEEAKDVFKSSYNKLMIVAHPDDDAIFGGGHLVNGDYIVVCVTCGATEIRLNEFINVMNTSKDKYRYLSHTDLTPRSRISDWGNGEKEIIKKELNEIIKAKNWDLIVTHNPDGEYGHRHHKMVDQIVTSLVEDKSKLYYFGKYYNRDTVDDAPVLDDETYAKKEELLALYKSQPACSAASTFKYMFKHETWIQYYDWK